MTSLAVSTSSRHPLPWTRDDGGRAAAGYLGDTGDCAARAAAIVTGLGYKTVYDEINRLAMSERPRGRRLRSNARTGFHKELLRRWLPTLGYEWTPRCGSAPEPPCTAPWATFPRPGPSSIVCSRHFTALVDGVIHDTYDPSRSGNRAVYGYYCRAGE
jgi:hypothetical protein